MEGRLLEQPPTDGAAFAEGVLDDFEAEDALAVVRLDVGFGGGFGRPRPGRVRGGVGEAVIKAAETGGQPAEHASGEFGGVFGGAALLAPAGGGGVARRRGRCVRGGRRGRCDRCDRRDAGRAGF